MMAPFSMLSRSVDLWQGFVTAPMSNEDPDRINVLRPDSLGPPAFEPYAHAQFRLEVALKAREREIDLLWSRSLMFWGFVAAAFAGTAYALNGGRRNFAFVLSCFGFACASLWTLANRGSRFWFLNWERKVEEYERAVIGSVFANPIAEDRIEKRSAKYPQARVWWSARRYSPSRLVIALSDFVVGVWGALIVAQIWYQRGIEPGTERVVLQVGAALATLAYVAHVRSAAFGGEPAPLRSGRDHKEAFWRALRAIRFKRRTRPPRSLDIPPSHRGVGEMGEP
jgi:hypothetical protein